MSDKSPNFLDSKLEEMRYAMTMMPSYLLIKGVPEGKKFISKINKLSKKKLKQRVQLANIFNDLATTQANPINMSDINFEAGEQVPHPYTIMLRILNIGINEEIYKHAQMIDKCLHEPFSPKIIDDYKIYFINSFKQEESFFDETVNTEEFYFNLILGFIAHLDAYVHLRVYSENIKPISLGYLFMHKINPNKWEYDDATDKPVYIQSKRSPFTCTSRSLLHFLETVLYCQKYQKMPITLEGINNKLDIGMGNIDRDMFNFIRKKKARDSKRNWINLGDVFWLLNYEEIDANTSNPTLENWQASFVSFLKSEDMNDLGGLPFPSEIAIWFVYAFFQHIYEKTDINSKQGGGEICIYYDEYYDLWQIFTSHYEKKVVEKKAASRTQWPEFLRKQATPLKVWPDLKH